MTSGRAGVDEREGRPLTDREKARDIGRSFAMMSQSFGDVFNDALDALERNEAELVTLKDALRMCARELAGLQLRDELHYPSEDDVDDVVAEFIAKAKGFPLGSTVSARDVCPRCKEREPTPGYLLCDDCASVGDVLDEIPGELESLQARGFEGSEGATP